MWQRLKDTATGSVKLTLDRDTLRVPKGISVAAAMLLAGAEALRTTPVTDSQRAPYCMMGVCFDCLMEIDGRSNQRACMVTVRAGMQIRRQRGARNLAGEQ